MANFVYLIGCRETRECWVVDPAWDLAAILDAVEEDGYRLTGALATHYHPDHVGGECFGYQVPGLMDLLEKHEVPIHVQRLELPGVAQTAAIPEANLTAHEPGEVVNIGKVPVKLLHTPGHTPGSQCFLVDGNLVSGDTLFINACGRVDLPGGDAAQLYRSLNQVLRKLPEQTRVFPGHDYANVKDSTIAAEIQNNPYFQFESVDQFLRALGVA